MNTRQKKILIIISIVDICFLIILFFISASFSLITNVNNKVSDITNNTTITTEEVITPEENKTTTEEGVTPEENTTTNKEVITSEENTTTNKEVITSEENTTTNKEVITSEENTTTIITDGIKNENLKENEYYYGWSDENSTDFTRRNCLFIYDSEQNRINGEIELIYFKKYTKTQKITNDINNCFLEDKNSVIVKSIIIEGIHYDKINNK